MQVGVAAGMINLRFECGIRIVLGVCAEVRAKYRWGVGPNAQEVVVHFVAAAEAVAAVTKQLILNPYNRDFSTGLAACILPSPNTNLKLKPALGTSKQMFRSISDSAALACGGERCQLRAEVEVPMQESWPGRSNCFASRGCRGDERNYRIPARRSEVDEPMVSNFPN